MSNFHSLCDPQKPLATADALFLAETSPAVPKLGSAAQQVLCKYYTDIF
jgi:hypothetical protein